MACTTCQIPRLRPALPGRGRLQTDDHEQEDTLMPLSALTATASSGCQRCNLILKATTQWKSVDNMDDFVVGIVSGGNGAPDWEGLYVLVSHKDSWERRAPLYWSRRRGSPYMKFDFDFEIYTEDESISRKWDLPVLTTVPAKPTPADYATQASKWLEHCTTKHRGRCSPSEKALPTRVVYVGNEIDNPRLHQCQPGEKGQYAALSYCWGLSRTFTTTVATLEQRKLGFMLDDLPATIRDAVLLARNMNLQYIWADSLCIIQDSDKDWAQEAARMCSVYSNATITFAAMDCPDSETGLFVVGGRRLIEVSKEQKIYARKHYHGEVGRKTHPIPASSKNLLSNILQTRGWCFQELLLSSRILWMKGTEMCWSCLCEAACECQPQPSSALITERGAKISHTMGGLLNLQFVPTMTTALWLREWFDLVQAYTDRSLTHSTDRLPAVAGLATWLQSRIKARYLFGLWETEHLRRQLLWQVYTFVRLPVHHRPPQGQLMADYAPSWSWASCWGSVIVPTTLTETSTYSTADTPYDLSGPSNTTPSSVVTQDVGRERPRFAPIHHTPVWTVEASEMHHSTANIFGPGTGTIFLSSLVVCIGSWRESDTTGQTLHFGWTGNNPTTNSSSITLFDTENDGYAWRPDNRYDFEDKPEWYNSRQICFVFANFGVLRTKEGELDFCGLLLERIDNDEAQHRRFRRLGYAEGIFRSPDQYFVEDGVRKETWERWQEIGAWETVALV